MTFPYGGTPSGYDPLADVERHNASQLLDDLAQVQPGADRDAKQVASYLARFTWLARPRPPARAPRVRRVNSSRVTPTPSRACFVITAMPEYQALLNTAPCPSNRFSTEHPCQTFSSKAWTRRQFLHTGLMMTSATMTIPLFLQRSAGDVDAGPRAASVPGVPDENDACRDPTGRRERRLNTSFRSAMNYRAARASRSRRRCSALGSDHEVGLHPAMTRQTRTPRRRLLSVVQVWGTPTPTAHTSPRWTFGKRPTPVASATLARPVLRQPVRRLARSGRSDAERAVRRDRHRSSGERHRFAMQGRQIKPIAFDRPTFSLGRRRSARIARRRVPRPDGHAPRKANRRPRTTTRDPTPSSGADRARPQVASERSDPPSRGAGATTGLGRQLASISCHDPPASKRSLLRDHGVFDHAGRGGPQNGQHANLVRQFSDAVKAFYDDLRATGHDQRVLTMSFSEFGRRV